MSSNKLLRFTCGSVALVACLSFAVEMSDAQEIVIDNNTEPKPGEYITSGVFGFRNTSDVIDAPSLASLKAGKLAIPVVLVKESALRFDQVREALADANLSAEQVSLPKLKKIISGTNYENKYMWGKNPDLFEGKPTKFIAPWSVQDWPIDSSSGSVIDAAGLTNLLVSGVIDANAVYYVERKGKKVQFAFLDDKYNDFILKKYKNINKINWSGSADKGKMTKHFFDMRKNLVTFARV